MFTIINTIISAAIGGVIGHLSSRYTIHYSLKKGNEKDIVLKIVDLYSDYFVLTDKRNKFSIEGSRFSDKYEDNIAKTRYKLRYRLKSLGVENPNDFIEDKEKMDKFIDDKLNKLTK